ncbi:restriction endonuclease subunit S [Enterococcus rivorum]|uniref:Restriction endonuclease subunit S n=2 Tax=Enterococcus rivorum TaxID=762845 RepID=A0A1E5KYI4_9ENTE|nr:restriction endonuclease subunit S [Enterococcus rivorum]MBP2097492.1 type I restriction enzyme S subunit [Enterococcus rivorum]OEH82950.1 restriction endonuclease subunit S [Enterococcus rivorum]
MSKLEELIEELCPDGVEYKKVKDCFTRLKGTSITAGKMKEIENKNGEIKIFAGGKTVVNAKEEDIPNANITRVPAVLVQSRGVIDIVYFEKPFTFKNEMWAYTNDEQVTVKYLFYVLKNSIQIFRDSASGMGALPQISLKVTEDFVFPLPPLPVQAEIVRILDNFTELTAELTAELMARKKQYEYYRIYLFNSVKSVQMKTLDNIAENCDSERKPVKSGIREIGDIPYYGASGIIDHVQDYIYEGDYLLISEDGANLLARTTPIAFSISGKSWVNNHAHVLRFDEYATRRYVEIYLNSIDLTPYITGAAQPKLNQKNLNSIEIPLPALSEQQRIVDILDRFDTLCNDLTEGLPAEILARQKQYEYYRKQLLTFPKAKIEV